LEKNSEKDRCFMIREANREDLDAFLENVVTHADYRGKGYATECLDFAKKIAEQENCYKMMLLTGSKSPETLRFYEKAGYNSSDKTAFIHWIRMDK